MSEYGYFMGKRYKKVSGTSGPKKGKVYTNADLKASRKKSEEKTESVKDATKRLTSSQPKKKSSGKVYTNADLKNLRKTETPRKATSRMAKKNDDSEYGYAFGKRYKKARGTSKRYTNDDLPSSRAPKPDGTDKGYARSFDAVAKNTVKKERDAPKKKKRKRRRRRISRMY